MITSIVQRNFNTAGLISMISANRTSRPVGILVGSHSPNRPPYPQRDSQILRRIAVNPMSSSLLR